ncbi:hypothetical protein LXL04_004543 [Taraxacum kok-saghyz]
MNQAEIDQLLRCMSVYTSILELESAKEDLDVLLETGLNKFPGNVLFNKGDPNIPTDITPGIQHTPNIHQQPEPNEGAPNIPTDITPRIQHTHNHQQPEPNDNKENVEHAEYNDTIILFDKLEESPLKSCGLQLIYDSDEDTTKDVHSPRCRRLKKML